MGTIELPLIMVKVLPRRYAERFVIKGQVHFSRSTQWARAGQLGEVVRGDPLEGCFAATEAEDPFLLSMYDDVESFEQDGLVRYRRRRSGSLAIFCLYGVMAKDLDQSRANGLGITERYTYIPKLFFDSLSNADDDSAFSKMPEDDRPAAVIITNAKAFLERLASSVNQIMGRQCRLWFGRVRYHTYVPKHTGMEIGYSRVRGGTCSLGNKALLAPVFYGDRPDVSFVAAAAFVCMAMNGSPANMEYLLHVLSLLQKASEWEHEREWRVIACSCSDDSRTHYGKMEPDSVYLGIEMQEDERGRVIEIAKSKGWRIYEMVRNDDSFDWALAVRAH